MGWIGILNLLSSDGSSYTNIRCVDGESLEDHTDVLIFQREFVLKRSKLFGRRAEFGILSAFFSKNASEWREICFVISVARS